MQVGGGGVGVEPGEDEEDGQKVDSDEEKEASPAFPHLGLSLPAAAAVRCISHDGRIASLRQAGGGSGDRLVPSGGAGGAVLGAVGPGRVTTC